MKNREFNLLFLIGILSILIPTGIFANEFQGLTIYPKIILLDENDNSSGWNPGNNITKFTINDTKIDIQHSIVILNVHMAQPGPVKVTSCGLDWINNATSFDIVCSTAPNEGSSLHYIIINH